MKCGLFLSYCLILRETGNAILCGCRFEPVTIDIIRAQPRKHFFPNSEEMSPRYKCIY